MAETSYEHRELMRQAKEYAQFLQWAMGLGLAIPGISGLVLCACAVIAFFVDQDMRQHEAVFIAMIAIGGLLILGGAVVAAWKPEGYATYLATLDEMSDDEDSEP